MLLFLDTEYNNIIDTELVSIGLVSECEKYQFYAELTDFNRAKCSVFVQGAVLPQLGKMPAITGDRSFVAAALWSFLESLPTDGIVVMDDAGDWDLFTDLLDYQVPSTVSATPAYVEDQYVLYGALAAMTFEEAKVAYFMRHQTKDIYRHHALLDAKANLAAYRVMCEVTEGPLPAPQRKTAR
jgi:hypothetical protein